MKKLLMMTLMFAAAHSWAATPVSRLAHAIAKAEGFYVRGSIPNRLHNPGDIRSKLQHAYPGQIGLNRHGYVIFKDDASGWAALTSQIDKIISGESTKYNVNMTLAQLARKYATSPTWVRNVSRFLSVKLDTRLWEILDVAPRLENT